LASAQQEGERKENEMKRLVSYAMLATLALAAPHALAQAAPKGETGPAAAAVSTDKVYREMQAHHKAMQELVNKTRPRNRRNARS
jgi:Skp family chaperone for outer membrane proteins